jgi:tRNA1(Val) A37 N6-methylase TrmN6
VFFNPPFHPGEGTQSPNAARNAAKRDPGDAIRIWTDVALKAVRTGGTVTAILSFERVPDMLADLKGKGALVFPLFPSPGSKPKRAIVQVTADQGEVAISAGLVLHREVGSNSAEAEAILRFGSPLALR